MKKPFAWWEQGVLPNKLAFAAHRLTGEVGGKDATYWGITFQWGSAAGVPCYNTFGLMLQVARRPSYFSSSPDPGSEFGSSADSSSGFDS